MMLCLAAYAAAVTELPARSQYVKQEILSPRFRLETEGHLTTYYAPFDHINHHARVALVGVTPGWTQTEIAFRIAHRELATGSSVEEASYKAKIAASFAGTMRSNLVHMLDDLDLPNLLGIQSSSDLFGSACGLCHMTSAFRYPVFYSGRNYTGSTPPPQRSAMLMRMAREILAPELLSIGKAVVVPLGRAVDGVLSMLEDEGLYPRGRRLVGFPHPSGANGHRARQFQERRADLRQILKDALASSAA